MFFIIASYSHISFIGVRFDRVIGRAYCPHHEATLFLEDLPTLLLEDVDMVDASPSPGSQSIVEASVDTMDWEPVPGDAEAFQADAMEWEPCPGPTSGSHPFVEASVDTMDWEPVPGDAEAFQAEPINKRKFV